MLQTATPDEFKSIMIDPDLQSILNKTISKNLNVAKNNDDTSAHQNFSRNYKKLYRDLKTQVWQNSKWKETQNKSEIVS